jgi:hypothetical protein
MNNYRILRVIISIVALAAIASHLLWPALVIDGITLGLLILAALPWLAPLIKSIEVPGIGKVELQEIKQQAQEAKGAALSATQKAELALAGASPEVESYTKVSAPRSAEQELENLVEKYNTIRATQPSGDARTSAMTGVVSKMIRLFPRLKSFDVETPLKERNRGKRLSAYAYLYANPDIAQLENLVNSVTQIEDKPFGQYWGIQAIGKVLGSRGNREVNRETLYRLRQFLSKLQPGTDRHYELTRILSGINGQETQYPSRA